MYTCRHPLYLMGTYLCFSLPVQRVTETMGKIETETMGEVERQGGSQSDKRGGRREREREASISSELSLQLFFL